MKLGIMQVALVAAKSTASADTTTPAEVQCVYGPVILRNETDTISWKPSTKYQTVCDQTWQWRIQLAPSYAIVVSFSTVRFGERSYVTFTSDDDNATIVYRKLDTQNNNNDCSPLIIRGSELRITVMTPMMNTDRRETVLVMTYTAEISILLPTPHPVNGSYRRESRQLYNCHLSNTTIPKAFRCDTVKQCLGGEDEEGCGYRTLACGDWVPYRNHCLKPVFFDKPGASIPGMRHATMPYLAEQACRTDFGARLAALPDSDGFDLAYTLVRMSGYTDASIGLYKHRPTSQRLAYLYRYTWQWGGRGGPVAHEQGKFQEEATMVDCAMLSVFPRPELLPQDCVLLTASLRWYPSGYICMRDVLLPRSPQVRQTRSANLTLNMPSAIKVSTVPCPDGSRVLPFHPCHWSDIVGSSGEAAAELSSSQSVMGLPLFPCRFGLQVHYSLVCDGWSDCPDGSDELGCLAPRRAPLRDITWQCGTFQLVPETKRCDFVPDCFDGSDEQQCFECNGNTVLCPMMGCMTRDRKNLFPACPSMDVTFRDTNFLPLMPRVAAHHDFLGWSFYMLDFSGGKFVCDNLLYIQAYMVNNGEKDCMDGEDENIPLQNLTCTGFYRCLGSGQCLHPDQVCDGVYQCPAHDDERYCVLTCPDHCRCEGLALTCNHTFSPLLFLQARYVDVSGVDLMSSEVPFLSELRVLELMQLLNVSGCDLRSLALGDLPTLRVLDLSDNVLGNLSTLTLHGLEGLRCLDLSHNPLVLSLDHAFSTLLSDAGILKLETLLLRGTGVVSVADQAFSPLSQLLALDLRQTGLTDYGPGIFKGLHSLRELYADYPNLCCPFFHGGGQRDIPDLCRVPRDEVSSCKDLLDSDFFRVFLWLFATLAILGNASVLFYRLTRTSRRNSASAFPLLVTNLCQADLLMGLYLALIGAGDVRSRGHYVQLEHGWRHGGWCQAAGVLGFMSCEASRFTISLITLDRLLVVWLPLRPRLHLSRRAAVLCCTLCWLSCLLLAFLPVLLGLQFYDHSAICLPLPVTRRHFSGRPYAFAVFIVTNFFFFLFIGVGQALIVQAARATSRKAGTQRHLQEVMMARRLLLVVLTDLGCWLPVGLAGMMAEAGVAAPGEVYVWIAIFVLPLNAALNPFFYTLNGLREKWGQKRMEDSTKRMLKKMQVQIPKWSTHAVESLLILCIRSQLVPREKIHKWLGSGLATATEDSQTSENQGQ